MSAAARIGRLVAIACLLAHGPAAAAAPGADKLAGAVAEANRKAGRAKPLLLDVSLREGGAPARATGTLATHPTGLARLELRGADGLERHLLQGSRYEASRDGEIVASPRPLLPPLFLLQEDTGTALRAALASFGVASSETGFGLEDGRDCYLIGGERTRSADPLGAAVPRLWVEIGSYEIAAVERADGVRYRFGPPGRFDGVLMPKWIEIRLPGDAPPLRLEIQRVAQANAPAAAFGREWLSGAP